MSKLFLGVLLPVMLSACANLGLRRAENCPSNTDDTEIVVLRDKLRAEEARAAALQQKLDALKAIEQQIQQRQTPAAEATK